jgi:3-methyl-2-oxobutanoate hydroxymethyltransferase
MANKPITVADIVAAEGRAQPLVCLTAYDQIMAQLADQVADSVSAGDSLAMVAYGQASTLPATLDIMIAHGRSVVAACRKALAVVGLPFGHYQSSPAQAFDSAARVLEGNWGGGGQAGGGAGDGGNSRLPNRAWYPRAGSYRVAAAIGEQHWRLSLSGPDAAAAAQLLAESARRWRRRARSAWRVQAVAEGVARAITQAVAIPTIGIGASVACDGQILVSEDLLGWQGGRAPLCQTLRRSEQPGRQRPCKPLPPMYGRAPFPARERVYGLEDGAESQSSDLPAIYGQMHSG